MTDHIEKTINEVFTPERVAGNIIQQHEWEVRTFLNLVQKELKLPNTVELGSYRGWMSVLLSTVSKKVISIDTQEFGPPEDHHQYTNLKFLKGSGDDLSLALQVFADMDGWIDLLFIDDGHHYETICKEFEIWKRLIRPDGRIVFHDINPLANLGPDGKQPESMQVTRFWNELKGNKQEIIATQEHAAWKGVIPHGGLGILRL